MPEEMEMRHVRLQALHDATHDFWLTLGEVISKLEGGEELDLNGTIYRVIEANSRQLIIRGQGTTLRFPVNDPPLGVARKLVAESLGKDSARTRVVFGAFWATVKDADFDKARKYFQQAAELGANTKDLVEAIDDDYQLPK